MKRLFASPWAAPLALALALVVPAGINLSQYWIYNPLYGYGLWVPILAAVLVWQRRKDPCSEEPPGWGTLTGAVVAGFLLVVPMLRTLQIANPDWRLLDWLLAGGAVLALLALAFRTGGAVMLRRFSFPAFFLLSAVPWTTSAERAFTHLAVPVTARLAAELLWVLDVAGFSQGGTIHTVIGPLSVNEDCSGIRSLHLTIMLGLFWAGYFRLGPARGLGAMAGSLALALFLNLLRVVAVVAGTVWAGSLEALEHFHDQAGAVGQVVLTLCVPLIAWLLRPRTGPAKPLEREMPLPIWEGVPRRWATWVVAWLAAGELAAHGWYWMHEKDLNAPGAAWTFNDRFRPPGAEARPVPDSIRQSYRFSQARYLEWRDEGKLRWNVSWLKIEPGAQSASTHNVHRPESCLPAQDFALVGKFPDVVLPSTGGAVAFHHQAYQRNKEVQHLFFATLENVAGAGEQTAVDWTFEGRLNAAWLGLRSRGTQILHLNVTNPPDLQEVRAQAAQYLEQVLMPVPAAAKAS